MSEADYQNCDEAIHDETAPDLVVRHESFVDATLAAKFLSISRKYLLKLSRLGHVPGHPVGIGSRKQWRYRISELEKWVLSQNTIMCDGRQSKRPRRRQSKFPMNDNGPSSGFVVFATQKDWSQTSR